MRSPEWVSVTDVLQIFAKVVSFGDFFAEIVWSCLTDFLGAGDNAYGFDEWGIDGDSHLDSGTGDDVSEEYVGVVTVSVD